MYKILILLSCILAVIFGQNIPKSMTSCGTVTPDDIQLNLCAPTDSACNMIGLIEYDNVKGHFIFVSPVNSSTFSMSSMHAAINFFVLEFSLLDEPIDQCFAIRNRSGRVGCPIIANEQYLYTFDPKKTTLPQMPPHCTILTILGLIGFELKLKIVFQGDTSDLEICTDINIIW